MLDGAMVGTGGAPFLRRVDMRYRLVAAVLLVAACGATVTLAGAGLALGVSMGVALACGLGPGLLVHRLAPAAGFFALIFLALAFTYPGQWVQVWPAVGLFVSVDGIHRACLIALKGFAMLGIFLGLVCTASVSQLAVAMNRLGLPHRLGLLLTLTYRQIFLVGTEYARMRSAASLRGFAPRMNLRTYRTIASLLGQSLLRSMDRGMRIHQAMCLRGFDGRFRFGAQQGAPGPVLVGAGALVLVVLVGLCAWERQALALGGVGWVL